MSRAVGIQGLGVVSPIGSRAAEFRDALLAGVSGIRRISRFDASACRTQDAATIEGLDLSRWIPPMKLRRLDVTASYALIAARQACEDGAFPLDGGPHERAGVVFGTFTAGGQATSEYLAALHQGGPTGAPALLFSSTVGNAAASFAGLELAFRGPNATISQKEASASAAIAMAVDLLRDERAEAIVAGGVDAVYEVFFKVHDRFRVMAPASEQPSAFAPFDADRRGFVLGEGGFALLLGGETGRHGAVLGVGTSSAAVAINAWPADPAPLVRTMRLALVDAGLAPADVHVVYASANASAALDAVEAEAIRALFDGHRPVVTSVKGALGESGATGAASCVAALLCGAAGRVPPVAGLSAIDPACAELAIARDGQAAPGPIALVNSVGSGGSLVSLVLRSAG